MKLRGATDQKTEAKEIYQLSLFPDVTEADIEKTLFWLKHYRNMKLVMHDFEKFQKDMQLTAVEGEVARRISNEEYYANKTANAVLLNEKQEAIYEEYARITTWIEAAQRVIPDEETKRVIKHRYLEGHDYKTCLNFFYFSRKTFDRKLLIGTKAIANNLKLWGVLEQEWAYGNS